VLLGSFSNSLGPINNLINTKLELGKAYEKLSSGLKINKASDNPAGLVISEKMRSQIAGIAQQIKNIEYQNNKYATAEGSLATMQLNLQEMRDVALAASNDGVVTDEMRGAYQTVLDRNLEGYNNIIENTYFGSQSLLDGSEGSVADVNALTSLDITDPAQADQAVAAIDKKIDETLSLRAEIGAKQKYEFGSQKANLQTEIVNLTGSESVIRDTDYAKEFVNVLSNEIKLKVGMSILAKMNILSGSIIDILAR